MNKPTSPVTAHQDRPRKIEANAVYRSRSSAGDVASALAALGRDVRADMAGWYARVTRPRETKRIRRPSFLGLKQITKVVAAGTAGIALVAFIAIRLYERTFVIYPAEASYVAADTIVLAAPASGQLQFIKTDAAQGEPAFSLLQDDGRTISVDMPCECVLANLQVQVGSRVTPGAAIGEAIGRDPEIYVVAMLDLDRLLTLYGNPHISVTFVDGETVPAVVNGLPRISELESSRTGMIRVKFQPQRKLGPVELGQPVTVALDTFQPLLRSWKSHLAWLWPERVRAAGANTALPLPGKSDREINM